MSEEATIESLQTEIIRLKEELEEIKARISQRNPRGAGRKKKVLSPEFIAEVKSLHSSGFSQRKIALNLSVSRKTVATALKDAALPDEEEQTEDIF